jgi:hypothetical protein
MLEWPGHRNDVPSDSHAETNAKLMKAFEAELLDHLNARAGSRPEGVG